MDIKAEADKKHIQSQDATNNIAQNYPTPKVKIVNPAV